MLTIEKAAALGFELPPLIAAALSRDHRTLLSLLASGADPNVACDDNPALRGWTPLHWAVIGGDRETARILIEHGADPSFFSGGVTPTGLSAYTGNVGALRLISAAGMDTLLTLRAEHASSSDVGSTLLHRVLNRTMPRGKREVALFLVKDYQRRYGDPLPKDASGRTPLDEAVDDEAKTACMRFLARLEARRISAVTIAASSSAARNNRL